MAYATYRSDRTGATVTVRAPHDTEAVRQLAELIGTAPGTITVGDGRGFQHSFAIYRV